MREDVRRVASFRRHPHRDQPVVDGQLGQRRVDVADGRDPHDGGDGLGGDAQTRGLFRTRGDLDFRARQGGLGRRRSAAVGSSASAPSRSCDRVVQRLFVGRQDVEGDGASAGPPPPASLNARTSGIARSAGRPRSRSRSAGGCDPARAIRAASTRSAASSARGRRTCARSRCRAGPG